MRKKAVAMACTMAFLAPVEGGANPLEKMADSIEDRWSDGIEYSQSGHRWANAGRTGYVGPNYSWRAPIGPNSNLVDFEPPNASADCGGVDFHMGAFSVISGSELREQLSAMAGPQIATHALGVALDIMSPTIAAEMKRLQNELNKWNEWAKNDCALAEQFISEENVRASGLGQSMEKVGKKVGNSVGAVGGWAETATDFVAGDDLSGNEKNDYGLTGNLTWDALNNYGLDSYTLFSSMTPDESKEVMMSMIGTVVKKYDGSEIVRPPPNFTPTIPPRVLYEGVEAGNEIQILRCSTDACLNPEKQGYTGEIPSLVEQFSEALFNVSGDGGIYERFRNFGAPDLTNHQRAVVQMARGQMAQSLKLMSSDGNPPMNSAIDFWAKTLASNALHTQIRRIKKFTKEALQNDEGSAEVYDDLYKERFKQMEADLKRIREDVEKSAEDIGVLSDIRKSVHGTRDTDLLSAINQAQ